MEVLKHDTHGIQIVFRGHIEYGVIFVVELAMGLGTVAVAVYQMVVELPVGVEMAIRIHRHETRVLQKARIDLARKSRMIVWHAHDQSLRKPGMRTVFCKLVNRCRAASCVNRPTHHDHRNRNRGIIICGKK